MHNFTHKHSSARSVRYPARHAGLSLVELMVAITVGLLLLSAVSALIMEQSRASTELDKASRQIENGRYALQLLRDDIAHAGYYGEYFDIAAPAALPDPCLASDQPTVAELDAAVPLAIQGYDSPATVPAGLAGCLDNANHLDGTDILVLRKADIETIPVASAVAGQVYLQAGLNVSKAFDKVVGTGSDTSVFTLKLKDGSVAPLRRYLTHIYYVSPCNVPASGTACSSAADGGQPVPTLKRLELTVAAGAAKFVPVPLVEGVDNFQLDYGLDNDGDGVPDLYTTGTYSSGTTPMTAVKWTDAMTVRVNLLSRNNEPTVGYTDTKTYALGAGGTVGPFNDNYKRRAFSEIIRAVNPSGRRS